jgi:pilus assembly protein CpaE
MYPLAIGLVIQNSSLWFDVNAILREFPFRVVADFQSLQDPNTMIHQLVERQPEIVFVELNESSTDSALIISKLKDLKVCPTIVALHRTPTMDTVVAALRAGANEFLEVLTHESLDAIFKRAQDRLLAHANGKAIAVISVKGGCGSTTIACHSAVEMGIRAEARRKRALLMDLDFNTGLVRFLMKAQSKYSVLDAVSNLQKLDLNYWKALVCSTHPGLDVLNAPEELSPNRQLNRDQVQHMLSFARSHYDWIILDLGRGLGQLASVLLPELTEIYLIATPEIAPLQMTKNILRSLENAGGLDRVRLVLNRIPRSGSITRKEVEKVLGVPVFLGLPNDYTALSNCYSSGLLLPRRNKLAGGLQTLAAAMMGESAMPKETWASRLVQTVRWTPPVGQLGVDLKRPHL